MLLPQYETHCDACPRNVACMHCFAFFQWCPKLVHFIFLKVELLERHKPMWPLYIRCAPTSAARSMNLKGPVHRYLRVKGIAVDSSKLIFAMASSRAPALTMSDKSCDVWWGVVRRHSVFRRPERCSESMRLLYRCKGVGWVRLTEWRVSRRERVRSCSF